MAASFTVTPPDWVVVGQPLIFTCQTSSTITSAFRIVITVDEKNTAGTYQLLGKYYLTMNVNSRVHFDLNDVVHNMIAMDHLNNAGQDIHTSAFGGTNTGRPARDAQRQFRVGCGEFDGTTETLRDATNLTQVVSGYVSRSDGFNVNHLTDYGATTLTQKTQFYMVPQVPASGLIPITTIDVDPTDTGVVTHVMIQDASSLTRPYKITAITYNGLTAVDTQTLAALENYGYVNIGSGDPGVAGNALTHSAMYPAQVHEYGSFTGAWTKMEVVVLNAVDGLLSGIIRFRNQCVGGKSNPTRVAFANSVGGYSYYTMSGRRARSLTRRQKVVQKVVGTYGAATFAVPSSSPDTEVFGLEVEETFTLHGIVPLSDMFLIQEMFKSRVHSIQTEAGSPFIPVILDTSTIQIKDEPSANISEVSVDVKLAQRVRC